MNTPNLQSNISIEIDEIVFDYAVETTRFGEVIEVQTPFSKLPKGASELIVASSNKTALSKSKDYK